MDTLVSGQLYLRPPSQNPIFLNSHTNSQYFYIPVRGQLQLQKPFSHSEGVCSRELPPPLYRLKR